MNRNRDWSTGLLLIRTRLNAGTTVAMFAGMIGSLCLLPIAQAQTSVSFQWISGKETSVCDAYKKYIEIAAAQMAVAHHIPWEHKLMCARKIPSDFPEFVQPKWREIDPTNHLGIALSVVDNMRYDMDQQNPPTWLQALLASQRHLDAVGGGIKENYRRHRDKWLLAEADIDNDGKAEMLVKFRRGPCNDYPPDSLRYSIPVMVLNAAGTAVATAKSRQVVRSRPGPIIVGASSLDVFQYQGSTYVDRWDNEGDDHGKATKEKSLSVYLNHGDQSELVCRYRYVGNRTAK